MTLYAPKAKEGTRVMRYLMNAGMIVEHKTSQNISDRIIGYLLGKLEGFIAAKVAKLLPDRKQQLPLWRDK